jgi:hypothetical protein
MTEEESCAPGKDTTPGQERFFTKDKGNDEKTFATSPFSDCPKNLPVGSFSEAQVMRAINRNLIGRAMYRLTQGVRHSFLTKKVIGGMAWYIPEKEGWTLHDVRKWIGWCEP